MTGSSQNQALVVWQPSLLAAVHAASSEVTLRLRPQQRGGAADDGGDGGGALTVQLEHGGGGTATGGIVWGGGLLLAQALLLDPTLLGELPAGVPDEAASAATGRPWHGRRVVELGSGLGVVALAAAALGAGVIATGVCVWSRWMCPGVCHPAQLPRAQLPRARSQMETLLCCPCSAATCARTWLHQQAVAAVLLRPRCSSGVMRRWWLRCSRRAVGRLTSSWRVRPLQVALRAWNSYPVESETCLTRLPDGQLMWCLGMTCESGGGCFEPWLR